MTYKRKWQAFFWFVEWDCLSLGFHICLSAPNIEIHLPFGFIRIGREGKMLVANDRRRGYGWGLEEWECSPTLGRATPTETETGGRYG